MVGCMQDVPYSPLINCSLSTVARLSPRTLPAHLRRRLAPDTPSLDTCCNLCGDFHNSCKIKPAVLQLIVDTYRSHGYAFDALTPADMLTHFSGRTLWLMGDSQVSGAVGRQRGGQQVAWPALPCRGTSEWGAFGGNRGEDQRSGHSRRATRCQ